MNDEELRDLLVRATDAIEPAGLTGDAVSLARQRQRRRRGLTAVGGAALAVVAVLVGVTVIGEGASQPAPVSPPTSDSTPTPSGDRVQRWDPSSLEQAPLRSSPMPERLDPPASPPSIAELPVDAAIVAWPQAGHDLRLLGNDSVWRTVPDTADAVSGTLEDVVSPALSSDGRQVAMSVNDGILVVDLTTGERRTIPWPAELAQPWDSAPPLLWLPGDDGFVVAHWQDTWQVGLDGEAQKAPYGGRYALDVAVDPDGDVVERRWRQREMVVWREDQIERRIEFAAWGSTPFVTRHDRVALSGGDGQLPGDGGPMVYDTVTGELLAHATTRDPQSLYTDGGFVRTLGFLDEDTVLLLAAPAPGYAEGVGAGEETWYLAAWRTDSGEFERLTSGDTRMSSIAVAPDVLAAEG